MARRRVFFAISWLLLGSLAGAVGCFPPDEGRAVPLDSIYFPVGIAVSPGKSWMYVANSDFDLQFNAGSLQVYDLAKLRQLIPTYCHSKADCTNGDDCDTTGKGTGVGGIDGAPTNRCVNPVRRNPCESAGRDIVVQRVDQQLLQPGLCTPVDPAQLLKKPEAGGVHSVAIGAFVTDVIYATNPLQGGKGGRLFLPVRGDTTMHWIDVDDDTTYPDGTSHRNNVTIDCGQTAASPKCDQNHRRGAEPAEANTRNLVLPPEPYGLALQARPYGGVPDPLKSEFVRDLTDLTHSTYLTTYSEFLMTTHQTTGEISMFVNSWGDSASSEDGPQLEFVQAGLPTGALDIAAVPLPALWLEDAYSAKNTTGITYLPSFLTTFRDAPQVTLVRAFNDSQASPARPFVDSSRAAAIATNSTGFDSRGIAVDGSARAECESPTNGQCTDPMTRFECLIANCEPIPLDVYVANRAPASLVIGQSPPGAPRTLTDDLPRFYDSVPMSAGPSRVVVGHVIDTTGKLVVRVFVVCFDSRRIFVYDPKARRFEATIVTGRGPQAFALDIGTDEQDKPTYVYGYVGHFSDSYLGVIDLDQRDTAAYGTIVLSVGQRVPPRASK